MAAGQHRRHCVILEARSATEFVRKKFVMYFTTYLTRGALAALILVGTTGQAPPSTDLSSSGYAANPYTFAARCDLSQSLFFINVIVRNRGNSATFPMPMEAIDGGRAFSGLTTVQSIQPGADVAMTLPIRHVASSAGVLGGTHVITVTIGGNSIKPSLIVELPAAFAADCAANAPVTTGPAGTAGRSSGISRGAITGMAIATATPATPKPGVSQSIRPQQTVASLILAPGVSKVADLNPNKASLALLKPVAPSNLRSVGKPTDCGEHLGFIGAIACPAMINSGDLLVIWDWKAGSGLDEIDGYRLYRVDEGKQLVYTQSNKKDITLVDVPKPPSGYYTGRCYAVSAYAGSLESNISSAFCPAGGSVALKTRVSPDHMRNSIQTFHAGPGAFGSGRYTAALLVGYTYFSEKRLLGDVRDVAIFRSAFEFDVSRIVHRKLVGAKLFLTINSSVGEGNNHSCATEVGSGTEFWWYNDSWLQGQFSEDITPTDVGPVISADVTKIVEQWQRGDPNYGFVIKNHHEDLNAFTNDQCETVYTKPVLELTYY